MKSINVKVKPYGVKYFKGHGSPVTEGKIYNFPEITYDNGTIGNLNPDKRLWHKEFEFVQEIPQQNYEIY